jgi:hypothetical protein
VVAEELKVILVTEFDQARKELEKLKGELDGVRRITINWEQVGKDLKKLGREMSLAITAPIVLAFRAIIRYAKEQEKYSEVFTKLSDALKGFADVVMVILVPWLDKLADTITKITNWFNNLDESTKKTIISMLGLAASIGPFLIVGGQMVQGVSRTVDVFNALGEAVGVSGGVIALIVVAIAALTTAAILLVKNWDSVSAFFVNLWEIIKEAFLSAWESIKAFVIDTWPTLIGYITGPLGTAVGKVVQHWGEIVAAFRNAYEQIKELVLKIKEWLTEKLAAVVEPVKAVAGAVRDAFAWLKDTLVGHSIVPDMVDRVIEEMDRMDAAMESISGPEAFAEKFKQAQKDMQQLQAAITPFTDAFGAMIVNAENGAEALKEAMKGAIVSILEMLAKEAFARAALAYAAANIPQGVLFTAAGAAALVAAGAVKAMAEGGVVTRPTHALIGERGPEAVIPLNRAGNFGTVVINVQGSVLAEEDLSRKVLTAVRRAGRGY